MFLTVRPRAADAVPVLAWLLLAPCAQQTPDSGWSAAPFRQGCARSSITLFTVVAAQKLKVCRLGSVTPLATTSGDSGEDHGGACGVV